MRAAPSAASDLPKTFALSQNYPNPFNPTTTIQYALPHASYVRLTVYDVLGREFKTLVDEEQVAGYKTIKVDASSFASGVYFYRLQAGEFNDVKKLMLVK